MKPIHDVQLELLEKARKKYYREVKMIREGMTMYHMCRVLGERMETFFGKDGVTAYPEINGDNRIWLYLQEGQNIERDVNMFLEENEAFLTTIGGSEYAIAHDDENGWVKYNWKNFRIIIDYGSGDCKRVKVSSVHKVVIEDKYDVQCF